MSTTVTKERMASEPTNRSGIARMGAGETSPRLMARIAGVLYLLTILMGMFSAGFATGKLVVNSDAAATANNILAHRGLFQLAFAVYLIEMACQVALTALFYALLKPAGKSVSLVAAFLGLPVASSRLLQGSFLSLPCSSWEAHTT